MAADADTYACMVCGSAKFDAECARRPVYSRRLGRNVYPLWTYCRACDCWTEHPDPDDPKADDPYAE